MPSTGTSGTMTENPLTIPLDRSRPRNLHGELGFEALVWPHQGHPQRFFGYPETSPQTESGALSLCLATTHFNISPSLLITKESVKAQGSHPYLSSSCFKALSMFILCPTRVTPRSIKSSFWRFGRWLPSISLSMKVSLCSPKFRLSSQSATSGFVHRWTGLVVKGLFEIGCCSIEGDGDLLRPAGFKPKRSPAGDWLGRLKTSESVGEGEAAAADRGVGRISLFNSVGETTGLGARRGPEVLLS